jgi:hypothetical protein
MTAGSESLSLALSTPSSGLSLLEALGEIDLSSAHLLHAAGAKAVADPACRALQVDLVAVSFSPHLVHPA